VCFQLSCPQISLLFRSQVGLYILTRSLRSWPLQSRVLGFIIDCRARRSAISSHCRAVVSRKSEKKAETEGAGPFKNTCSATITGPDSGLMGQCWGLAAQRRHAWRKRDIYHAVSLEELWTRIILKQHQHEDCMLGDRSDVQPKKLDRVHV